MEKKIQTEIDKLRAIARFELDSDSLEFMENASSQHSITYADCNALMGHKLQFLLYHHVIRNPSIKIERNFAKQLSGNLVFLQQKYKEYLDFIKNIVDYFDANGIRYCFLKGFSIIDSLYKEKGIIYRDFGDIDILVEKKDVKAFSNELKKLGFIQGYMNDEYNLVEASRKEIIYWRLNSHQEQSFIKKSVFSSVAPFINCRVDINTTIFEGGMLIPPIPTADLLTATREVKLGNDILAKSLCYELELIQLCYHLYKDITQEEESVKIASYTLIKFSDIREYVKKYIDVMDVKKLLTYINANGIGNQIYSILRMVSCFYGDLNLDEVLNQIIHDDHVLSVPDWDEVLV